MLGEGPNDGIKGSAGTAVQNFHVMEVEIVLMIDRLEYVLQTKQYAGVNLVKISVFLM